MKTKSPLPVAHRPFWYQSLAKCALPLSLGLLFAVGAQATTAPHENNRPAQSAQKPQPLQQVTGTVVDTEGEALAGVTIRVKGTALGTTTDAQGRFTLRAKQGAVLQVSYIGYERQEVTVSGAKLNLTLQPNDNSLNEAVVIGYGTVRKADLAGSVAVMDSKAFKDQPITRVSDALQGRVSGVQVVSSGIPGGSVKIRVRGTGSITTATNRSTWSTAWCGKPGSMASTPTTLPACRCSKTPHRRPSTVVAAPTAWCSSKPKAVRQAKRSSLSMPPSA